MSAIAAADWEGSNGAVEAPWKRGRVTTARWRARPTPRRRPFASRVPTAPRLATPLDHARMQRSRECAIRSSQTVRAVRKRAASRAKAAVRSGTGRNVLGWGRPLIAVTVGVQLSPPIHIVRTLARCQRNRSSRPRRVLRADPEPARTNDASASSSRARLCTSATMTSRWRLSSAATRSLKLVSASESL
jgi:hypothetical protein